MTITWVEAGFFTCFGGVVLCVFANALLKRRG